MDKKYWEETDQNMFTESWLKHYGHIEHPFNKACFSHNDIALMEWDKHQITLQLATTKAELDKIKEHLAIEESECVRLCNEKNRFKAELQAEKAKAALDEISEIGQEMSLNSLKHDAVIEASLFIRSRITMNNIHCDDRSIGKRDILSLLDEYAESMQ